MKEPSIENFLAFERKYKCNQIEIEGMHVWALYRYEIHNAIKKVLNPSVSTGGEDVPYTKGELLKLALNALKPFRYRNVDVLFVGNGRRTKNVDTGVFEDIYCDEIAKKYNSVILEHPENHGHCQPNGMNNVYYTDRVAFETNLSVKLSRKFNTKRRQLRTNEVTKVFTPLFDAIEKEFGINLRDKLIPEIVDRMYYVDITKRYCGKILDKTKPKLIIEICYYAMECYAMSILGHERGIPTAEYSHGFAFPTHTPMQYNSEDNLPELPDYELIYSETQIPIVHLPSKVSMRVVGFPFFERQREHYKSLYPRQDKTICFVSTLHEGESISKVAAEVAEAIGDEYRIIYKLHPFEFNTYKQRYPWLNNDKLEVIANNGEHIFRYLAESSIIVSARTASVWEGIGFGCRAILLNYGDTAVNMEYFIREKNVPLVDTADEVVDLVRRDAAGYVSPDGMFEPDAMNKICSFIDEVIK